VGYVETRRSSGGISLKGPLEPREKKGKSEVQPRQLVQSKLRGQIRSVSPEIIEGSTSERLLSSPAKSEESKKEGKEGQTKWSKIKGGLEAKGQRRE